MMRNPHGRAVSADSENRRNDEGCPARAVRRDIGPLHVFGNLSRYNVPSRAVSVRLIEKEGIEMKSTEAMNSTARIPTGMSNGWSDGKQ